LRRLSVDADECPSHVFRVTEADRFRYAFDRFDGRLYAASGHTWPYYDLRKQAEFTGWESSKYHIELAAVPQEYDEDGTEIEEVSSNGFQSEDIARVGVLLTKYVTRFLILSIYR